MRELKKTVRGFLLVLLLFGLALGVTALGSNAAQDAGSRPSREEGGTEGLPLPPTESHTIETYNEI